MKKLLSLITVVSLTFSLVACGGSSKEDGELTVWWPGGSPAERTAIDQAKIDYELENPEVTINIVPQSTSNFYIDYMMSLNGVDYPDIAYVDHVYVQQLVYNGAIANLSDAGLDRLSDTFIESLWAPNTYEDHLYALPFSANVLATVYNKTLIEAVLGREMTDDDVPSTYDDLIAISQKILDYNVSNGLTGDDAYTPYTVPAGNSSQSFSAMAYLSFVKRLGGNIITDDLKTMLLNEDPSREAAELIQYLGQMGYSSATFEEGRFESGKVGFIEMGPWKITEYSRIAENRDFEFGYAPIISLTEGGSRESALGLYSLVVTDKSINKDLAIDFIEYIATSDKYQLLHNTAQNLMPTTNTALEDDFYTGEVWDIYVEQLNHIVARPGSPEWAEMERQLGEFVTALLNGTRDPDYVASLNYALQRTLDELYS
ncbi:extracellular solute-binding protein [Mycoplasmatota bacterium]|nr:extracellular solute-binding protein [Mycoplasmatota bacterium]